MACNYVNIITDNECIGDSLVKINSNFTNLNTGVCDLNTLYDNIGTTFASSLAQIRLSTTSGSPIITNDTKNVSVIYLHPFNGNAIGLFNTTLNRWEIKNIPSVLPFTLSSLGPNTNYDIYLYQENGVFKLDFTQWSSNTRGSKGPFRFLKDGARVKSSDYSRRFIGCLRTVLAGQTEVSFGRGWVAGGSHPKFFLWNAYNRVPAAFSIFDNETWNVTGPGNGAANNNGPFSNFGYRNSTRDGTDYRVSFISGDPTQLNLHQDHWSSGGWAYLTHALDLDQSNSPICNFIHRQGQFVSESQGQITHNSNFIVPEGYHFIQSLAMSYGGGTYWNFEGAGFTPDPSGVTQYPNGRHSYGTTGEISGF